MRHFSASPIEMFANLWRNRELIKASAKREVLGRYRGSFLGLLWSFFNPLFMLAVYTFVFSVVFKARWNVESDSKTEFALVLFAGLIVFNLFGETINRAASLVINNPNYVKKVVFPLEILPVVTLLSALFHGMISLGVWFLAHLIFFGLPHATVLYLPLIILPSFIRPEFVALSGVEKYQIIVHWQALQNSGILQHIRSSVYRGTGDFRRQQPADTCLSREGWQTERKR